MIRSWVGAVVSAFLGVSASLLIGEAHWSQPLLWAIGLGAVWVVIDGFFLKGFLLSKARRLRLNRRQDNSPTPGAEPGGRQQESPQPPTSGGYGFANYGSSNVFYTDTETDSGYLNVDSHNIHYTRARHKGRPVGDAEQP